MQFKQRLVYIVLSCVLMLSGAVLLINVLAQAPEQAQIAFASYRDENLEIYVMDADGQNPRNLTNNPVEDGSPSWSPDGGRIAFASLRDGSWEIYVMDADGNNLRNIAGGTMPAWSPDGSSFAFVYGPDETNSEIYVMDADGQNRRNLTNHPAIDLKPDWFDPAFARIITPVTPAGNLRGTWGWLKQTSK